jgi:hypothetical protein
MMDKGKKGKGGLTIIIMGGSPKGKGKMNKREMGYGGSVGGKKHLYVGGGSVTDNAGLRALKKASPEAYMNIKNG